MKTEAFLEISKQQPQLHKPDHLLQVPLPKADRRTNASHAPRALCPF